MFKWLSKLMYSLLATFTSFKFVSSTYEINTTSYQTEVNEDKKVSNFFVLGDSLADPGNLVGIISEITNKILNSIVAPQFLKKLCEPYQTGVLAQHYFENRYTNSLVFTEIVASKLNVESKRAWNCSTFISTTFSSWWFKKIALIFVPHNSAYGNNYALANSKAANISKLHQSSIKEIKNQIWKTIFCRSSYQQLGNLTEDFEVVINNFLSLNNQTETLLRQHQIKENDLVFICIGSNDVIDIADISNKQQVDKAIDEAIEGLKISIEKLILNKTKRVIVTNIVDLGKIPARLNYFSNEHSHVCCIYNEKWEKMMDTLQEKYLSVTIQKFNLNELFIKYLKIYEEQGKNIAGSFVSYEEQDFFAMLMGEKIEDSYKLDFCELDNYFFFDQIHPTGKVHEIMAEELFKIINDN